MTALDEIAYSLGIRDEIPNQTLAKKLAATSDSEGIREIAEHLWDKNKDIQNDCIKVLYEVGEIKPDLIVEFADDFMKLLKSKNNRLIWGAMTALAAVARADAIRLSPHIQEIIKATRSGSVITVDSGVKTLALIGAACEENRQKIFPFLLEHLKTCRPKEVPQHSESSLPAVSSSNSAQFIRILQDRLDDLSPSGLSRVRKVIKLAEDR